MKRFDYRHIICIAITLGFIALGVFVFFGAVGRLIESCRDVGLSAGFYFCELFQIPHNITPTVNDFPKVPFFDFIMVAVLANMGDKGKFLCLSRFPRQSIVFPFHVYSLLFARDRRRLFSLAKARNDGK